MDYDEDYVLTSDNESTNSTISNSNNKNGIFLLDNLSENDIYDIIIDIYEQISEFLKNNILLISSPVFYKNMFETIGEILYNEWENARLYGDIYDEEDSELFEELVDFVEQTWDVYADFSDVPLRSISYENIRNNRIYINVNEITAKIQYLKALPQPAQRTPEWYEFRNNLLSASSLSKVFGSNSQVNSLIYEKCSPINTNATNFSKTNIESAAHWGVKYEPVTVMIYEHMFNTQIGEFGCIRHPKYAFIGASPDGINVDPESLRYGRMLEIKNIFNRDITGIPKEEYWVQTQIQMEVCDLEYCDFMETRIKEYSNKSDFYSDNSHEYKGVVLHFIETDPKSPTINYPHYKYMPLDTEIDDWVDKTRQEANLSGLKLFNILYWYLDEYSCVLIPRNRQWFTAALPKISDVWETIVKERKEGYEHRSTKKKILTNTIVTADTSGNTYNINNLNLTRSICLIKLD
jgi:putative phage-type endonuclease